MIPLFKVYMADSATFEVAEVLDSGYIGQGPKVDEFENKLSHYLETPYVNTVNCGTSGIHLILHMLKDGHRDEIITTPLTCLATNFPIVANGLKIKWADVDPKNCNIDMDDIMEKIGPKTLAIMVVHWAGYPCDLAKLAQIQDRCFSLYGHVPYIIEDCAHAFGAKYDGKPLGSHSNFCMFSFQAIKHVTTGDGGCIVCPNKDFHERAKLLRWYGLDRTSSVDFRCEQNVEEWGYKFHMNDIAATIGIENLQGIDSRLIAHRINSQYLRENLKDVDGLTLLEQKDNHESSAWIFTILVEKRDQFIQKMKENGIEAGRVHDRNDKHLCLKQFKVDLPKTDFICSKMCSLPCGWWLSCRNLDHIINVIKRGW